MIKRRIVKLSDIHKTIGNYLYQFGDADVQSIATHCNHPDKLQFTLNLADLNTADLKASGIDICYEEVDTPNEVS